MVRVKPSNGQGATGPILGQRTRAYQPQKNGSLMFVVYFFLSVFFLVLTVFMEV